MFLRERIRDALIEQRLLAVRQEIAGRAADGATGQPREARRLGSKNREPQKNHGDLFSSVFPSRKLSQSSTFITQAQFGRLWRRACGSKSAHSADTAFILELRVLVGLRLQYLARGPSQNRRLRPPPENQRPPDLRR